MGKQQQKRPEEVSSSTDSNNNNNTAERSTKKRDEISEIEKSIQKEWDEGKIFEVEVDKTKEKYLATFPYPYMNGRLHVGHVFSASKIEYACNYQRMKGKNVLWPFGFHCTGMPIVAAAGKLKREIEEFGNPPQFKAVAEEKPASDDSTKPTSKKTASDDPTKFTSKKTKTQQKGGTGEYQWNIMRGIGVPEQEIPKFVDPHHWIQYFPDYTMQDLKKLGLGIDWRRSFVTTDVNPYYDSFVRWQFGVLKEQGKIKFGKRYSIYSPLDKGICLDHDRSSGEGVVPQDYTGIKLALYEPYPAPLAHLQGKIAVSLIAGTLRPETMYGQTNVWVLPNAEYGVFQISETEAVICTEKAARNMAFQELSVKPEEVVRLATVTGWDILKIPIKAPLSKYPLVYTLPMETIIPEKGTGIVTSVPSDSPDDYINLMELKKKKEWRKTTYGIEDYMIDPYEPIPIISTPEYGDNAAEKCVKDLKINGPKQRDLLDKAKDIVYKQGFNEGTMLVGQWKGQRVNEIKNKARQLLIDQGQAIPYSEPTSQVISRSGDECVVALVDQWYLVYGEDDWRKQLKEYYNTVNFYSEETKEAFFKAADWLGYWACSRSFGLGTRIPWDEQYLIESLSDSTIYMAFYTVCHLLHKDIFGKQDLGIKASDMTPAVWDYVMRGKPMPQPCAIEESVLQKLRESFSYWYPVDLRSSGRDLVQNHLTFFFYNHLAIFGESLAPRSVRANGFSMLNNKKMSKSTGNFLTIADSIDKYGADATRLAFADAGDGLVDANFSTVTADAAILKLHSQYKLFDDIVQGKTPAVPGPASSWEDQVFENKVRVLIAKTRDCYEAANYRDALKFGFFEMIAVGNKYMQGKENKTELLMWYVEMAALLVAPICPHFAEYVWRRLLKRSTSVRNSPFPSPGAVDQLVIAKDEYLENVGHAIHRKLAQITTKASKKGSQTSSTISIVFSKEFPAWMKTLAGLIKPYFEQCAKKNEVPQMGEAQKLLRTEDSLKQWMKQCVFQIQHYIDGFEKKGPAVCDQILPFDEEAFLKVSIPLFVQENRLLKNYTIQVVPAKDDQLNSIFPGLPSILF